MRWSIPTRVVLWQLGLGVAAAVVWAALGELRDGFAAFVGASIAAGSSFYLALRMRAAGKAGTERALAGMLWAWGVKVVLSLLLLYAAARLLPGSIEALLFTFCLVLFVYLFALRWTIDRVQL